MTRIRAYTLQGEGLTCGNRTPGLNLPQKQWDRIVSNAARIDTKNIFMGDFNAHNVVWNCTRNDSNGEKFIQAIDDFNLFIHNTNTLPIADKIFVEMYDENWGSDHHPFLITVAAEKIVYHKKMFKIYSVKINWGNVSSIRI